MSNQPRARRDLRSAPFYGFPQPQEARFRIAFYGDPALGAGLARRHHVVWTRPEEARHVIEQECPDFLLVTARVDSLRSLRSKPLVSSTDEVSADFTSLLQTFRKRGVPVVYYGLTDDLELERHLPIARQCDAVVAHSERTRDTYLANGVSRASTHELGAFGYADPVMPNWSRGATALLRGASAKTGGSSPGRSYASEAATIGAEEIDQGQDAIRASRTGLELVRRTAWVGPDSLNALSETTSVLVPLNAWSALPTNAFDGTLKGSLPLLFGGHELRRGAATRWPTAPIFASIDDAVGYARDADLKWPRARFEAMLADVLDRFLIDDWLLEALRTTGADVPARVTNTDALLLVLDPQAVTPEQAAQLQDWTGADALELAGPLKRSPLEGMTFRTNVLAAGSRAAADWAGSRMLVHDATSLSALQLRLLNGWARVHPDAVVHVSDAVGTRVATLEPANTSAIRSSKPSASENGVLDSLLIAEPAEDIA